MRTIEVIAVVFGIVAVYLNARQNVMGWATGLVNVGLYTYLFGKSQLFALMALQIFFFIISLYGWYQWLRGGETKQGRPVTRIPVGLGLGLTAVALIGSSGLGWVLDRYTTGQQPYLDSSISVVSMVGQWMMARKYLETWWVWIGVNTASVPFFVFRGEYPTAIQYAVFWGLGVSGLMQWRRSLVASS